MCYVDVDIIATSVTATGAIFGWSSVLENMVTSWVRPVYNINMVEISLHPSSDIFQFCLLFSNIHS